MEDLPYDTIVVIIAFWMVLLAVIITLICRIKLRQPDDDTLDDTICPTSPSHPGRLIQIFYIGNNEASSMTDVASQGNTLGKILSIVEDSPPAYDEISEVSSNRTSIRESDSIRQTTSNMT